jgi:hypothetical protein
MIGVIAVRRRVFGVVRLLKAEPRASRTGLT